MKKKILIILLLLVLAVGAGGFIFLQNTISPVQDKSEKVYFTVEEGTYFNEVLADLEENGLIKNSFVAKLYSKLKGYNVVKANAYVLDKNMSLDELLTVIGSDYPFEYLVKYNFTVVEGSTLPQVAAVIAKNTGLTKEDVLAKWADKTYLNTLIQDYWFLDESILSKDIMYPLEGYLFPETYTVTEVNPTLDTYTRMMLDRTNTVLTPFKEEIKNTGWTPSQFIAFCSVVQREAQNEVDYAPIAGVFINRINKGMLLQSDITVLYALQRTGVDVSYADLQVNSKYNTYKYPGLPVGPISNVSESIIKHCLNYEKHDYYYFVAINDGKGTVVYTRSYAEHNAAIDDAIKKGVWW